VVAPNHEVKYPNRERKMKAYKKGEIWRERFRKIKATCNPSDGQRGRADPKSSRRVSGKVSIRGEGGVPQKG